MCSGKSVCPCCSGITIQISKAIGLVNASGPLVLQGIITSVSDPATVKDLDSMLGVVRMSRPSVSMEWLLLKSYFRCWPDICLSYISI